MPMQPTTRTWENLGSLKQSQPLLLSIEASELGYVAFEHGDEVWDMTEIVPFERVVGDNTCHYSLCTRCV